MRLKFLLLTGTSFIVSSCCSPGIRPQDANLFQAACGLASGDFERQTESGKEAAVLSRHKLDEQQAKSVSLETDLENQKAERDGLLLELEELENQNRQLDAKVQIMREDSAQAQQERATKLRKLRKVRSRLAELKGKISIEQTAFEQHHAEISRLKREIATLRMIISVQ